MTPPNELNPINLSKARPSGACNGQHDPRGTLERAMPLPFVGQVPQDSTQAPL
ncbi:hypothetical protein GO294_01314 [Ralstonia solanacearum]|nr:hypothetical protein [Ralstonia solanacearum]